jgi:glutamate--cysteine ligase
MLGVPCNVSKLMQDLLDRRLTWLGRRANGGLIRPGLRGIEKESLRVRSDGTLAHTPHPAAIGAALTHPYLTTDYSEALLEIVTPPLPANWEALQFLCDLHAFVHRRLDGELLWPASMPCAIGAGEEIPIADYGPSNPGMMRTIYRRGLGHRYGRAMQAIAGTHFNYSPPPVFWPAFREAEALRGPLAEIKSEQLMALVRNYRRYGWLIVYLFGASPAFDKSFKPDGHALLESLDGDTWYAPYATSLRMSDMGYRNKTQDRLDVSVNSLDEYVNGLTEATAKADPGYEAIGVVIDGEYRQLNANVLQIENEYYSSIRPKPKKAAGVRPIAGLRRHGVEYVEIRTMDLNPVDPVGLNQAQMRFLETLLMYCLLEDSPRIERREQEEIDARDLAIAREGRRPGLILPHDGKAVPMRDWGLRILGRLESVAGLLDADRRDYGAAVDAAREALREPDATPSARILAELRSNAASFREFGLALARSHHEYFLSLDDESERQRELAAAARDSLREAEALAERPDAPFDEYLRRYFAAG